MNVKLIDQKKLKPEADLRIIFLDKKEMEGREKGETEIFKRAGFKAGADEFLMLAESGRLYCGVEDYSADSLRIAAAAAVRSLHGKRYSRAVCEIPQGARTSTQLAALAQGFMLGDYSYEKHKSKQPEKKLKEILIPSGGEKSEREKAALDLAGTKIVAECVNLVRDIVNEPPSDLTPPVFSAIAKKLSAQNRLAIRISGRRELEKMGMGAFLAVNRASAYPPQLIHATYRPAKPKKRIVLVGKGITYDTGGLSLKPSDSMLTMKMDMGGAAAILGAVIAAKRLKLDCEVHAVLGVTENAIGRNAYKPDDILKAMNGKTIEVRNTDAEGRLVLSDCLCYAQKFKPDYILDIATLTGASMVALGEYTIGLMGHDQDLKDEIQASADIAGEPAAQLPFNRYLKPLLKSQIADISNISSSRYGGAITAALFLSEFIAPDYRDKWVHLDIAGPAYKEKAWGENPVGASGAGVRTVVEWLKRVC